MKLSDYAKSLGDGSLNILRKAVPNAFSNGVEGVVVHPVKVTLN